MVLCSAQQEQRMAALWFRRGSAPALWQETAVVVADASVGERGVARWLDGDEEVDDIAIERSGKAWSRGGWSTTEFVVRSSARLRAWSSAWCCRSLMETEMKACSSTWTRLQRGGAGARRGEARAPAWRCDTARRWRRSRTASRHCIVELRVGVATAWRGAGGAE